MGVVLFVVIIIIIIIIIIIPLYSNEHDVVDDDDVEYTLLTYSTTPLYENANVPQINQSDMVRLMMVMVIMT